MTDRMNGVAETVIFISSGRAQVAAWCGAVGGVAEALPYRR
jgi:hypothetical protein